VLINVAEWRPDILEEHVEELEALCNRRLRAERSQTLDRVALRRSNRRIEAHADALVLAAGHATRHLEKLLTNAAPAAVASAAFVVGCSDNPAMVARLVEVLTAGRAKVRLAILAALELRAGKALSDALAGLSGDAELEAGAMAVLAAHEDPRAAAMQPERLLLAASPVATSLAWRAVRRLAHGLRLDWSTFERGAADADSSVLRAVLEAAVATRQAPLVGYLRRSAAAPDLKRLEEHLFFAILASASDMPLVLALAASAAIGWERYRILSLSGRAPAVEALLAVMRAGDEVEGALAGAGFYRITGVDVAGDRRVPLVPSGTEPSDFSDAVHVCDPARAEQAWNALRGRMGGARWTYGVDTDAVPPEGLPAATDLESMWAAELRATFSAPGRRLRFSYETLSETDDASGSRDP
jgi:hypothetical protein